MTENSSKVPTRDWVFDDAVSAALAGAREVATDSNRAHAVQSATWSMRYMIKAHERALLLVNMGIDSVEHLAVRAAQVDIVRLQLGEAIRVADIASEVSW